MENAECSLFESMMERGAGKALLYYFEELKEMYQEASGAKTNMEGMVKWQDPNMNVATLATLQARLGDGAPSAEEVMAGIEKEQGIRYRDDAGEPMIFFEQWTKYLNDHIRLKSTGSSQIGGGGSGLFGFFRS